MNGIDKLAEAIRTDKSTQPYDTRAEVVRVSGSTAYVHIPGGVAETPVTMTIACKKGDTVQVRVSGGRAWIAGNETAPPTDDTKVKEVELQTELMKKRLTGVEGQYSEFIRTSEYIRSVVSDGDRLVSIINQTADTVQISANKINLNGYVTVASLESTDTTTINGGAIAAKSFTAKYNNSTDSADVTLNTNGLSVYHKYSNKDYRSDVKPGEIYLYIQGSGSSTLNGTSWAMWNSGVTTGTTVTPGKLYVETSDTYAQVSGSSFECNNSTSGRTGRFTASAAGNIGLYDASAGNYILCSKSDYEVYTPHPFQSYNGFDTTLRYPVGSSTVANQEISWLGATGANTLAIRGHWTTSTGATKTVAVSSSDVRLKDCVKDTDVDALYVINQIRLRSFRWKEDGSFQPIGVIADELEQLDPSLVVGGGTDKEGNPIYKSINNLVLISYLTKAVQELSAKVEELENKLSTMEDKNHGHS